MPLYLVWFVLHPDYHEFRLQELESLAGCFGIEKNKLWVSNLPNYVSWKGNEYNRPLANDHSNSFAWVYLPKEDIALRILERSVLVRGFMEVWASGPDHEKVKQILKQDEHVKSEFLRNYIHDNVDFSWKVRSIGKKLSRPEQVSRMNDYGFLFKGTEKVNLKEPSLSLGIFEDWRCINWEDEHSKEGISKEEISKVKSDLKRVYLGRIIGFQSCNDLEDKSLWWLKYTLNKRPILGPTTMDNELAFIMCNIAQVKKNDVVFDPFCGTGGILISASHFGATCFGSDLDLRVINGWFCSYVNPHMIKNNTIKEDHPRSIYSNFDYYKLQRPGIIRMDISQNSIRRSWIDAIVCDPPYGIRATSRTTNSNQNQINEQREDSSYSGNNYIHSFIQDYNYRKKTSSYSTPDMSNTHPSVGKNNFGSLQPIDDMIFDLLSFASKTLVNDGHLVFLLPLLASDANIVISNLIDAWKHIFSIDFPYMQTLGGGLGRLLVHMKLLKKKEK
ncbi:RNA methylase [Cryptosporidium ubiquitum]|uniref:RNA methylase n=1 Tax=Cryptosporidium ubiquitum TaxID=857276 RepID=A0A1J4MMQ5_9CRYT|nr:RNA methylase [Cryptosporidium ubiquitum]OII75478.1 RNA methylase [Cryptosporidium ubiquitum]